MINPKDQKRKTQRKGKAHWRDAFADAKDVMGLRFKTKKDYQHALKLLSGDLCAWPFVAAPDDKLLLIDPGACEELAGLSFELQTLKERDEDIFVFLVGKKEVLFRLGFGDDPDQAWFNTPEWQKGEKEASEDIKAGRTTKYDSGEDFQKSLDG